MVNQASICHIFTTPNENIRENASSNYHASLQSTTITYAPLHFQVERKRARNRVAASKCRMRKLERIAVLDGQANELRSENEQLAKLADKLRSQVYSLKQELRWHINNGCRIQQIDQCDQSGTPGNHQDFIVPATMDKATETSLVGVNNSYEMYDNSPDSTTSTVCVKKEPPGGFDDRRASIWIIFQNSEKLNRVIAF